jgi:hypothetical protein
MDKEKAEKTVTNSKKVRSYVALALVGLAAVLLVAWLVSGDDDDSSSSDSGEARIVTPEELREASSDGALPIYWAGERQETELELSRPDAQRTYVRYLTGGAEAGNTQPDFLTIGTYQSADPVAALRRQGKEGGVLGRAPGGATVYFADGQPQSVYVAFPDVEAQIEVYAPSFKEALQLVNSGQIVAAE